MDPPREDAGRPAGDDGRTRAGRAPTPPTPARALSGPQRVALFMAALHRDDARALVEGFADAVRPEAEAFLSTALGWDSSTRQARLAREFGAHPEAAERVKALVVEAPPPLRPALVEQVPPSLKAAFPHLRATAPAPPAIRELAARLVSEALRR